jgi:hypothetical protein
MRTLHLLVSQVQILAAQALMVGALLFSLGSSEASAAPLDLAPSATVTVSGILSGFGPERATDGTLTTAWNSGGFPTQWIEFDLGSVSDLVEINVASGQSTPLGISSFNITFDGGAPILLSGSTENGDTLTLALDPSVSAQVVRIEITALAGSWVALSEVQILAPEPVPSLTPFA